MVNLFLLLGPKPKLTKLTAQAGDRAVLAPRQCASSVSGVETPIRVQQCLILCLHPPSSILHPPSSIFYLLISIPHRSPIRACATSLSFHSTIPDTAGMRRHPFVRAASRIRRRPEFRRCKKSVRSVMQPASS